ncbi:uncharacterized protein SCHCODRAFT_02683636 [Schizophyllum commune H4-8]|nr:uncharacterized protein SCHCODRAFT_02683636 [Schizophyllum commune H4-8]KAI5900837.1 hypothetical protein SCHCODRAFT_02683636 [Schizophyllum commune H4-8]
MRRSTRIESSRGVPSRLESATADEKPDTSLEPEPSSVVNAPPHKRQKTMVKCEETYHANDSVFSLQQLPLDILFEIFNLLDPISLFHLSRASKALRSTLIGRSLVLLWKKSYAGADLPPVPNDLNIPQFLGLVVDDECDFCHTSPADGNVYRVWEARKRCCRNCQFDSAHIVRPRDMHEIKVVRDVQRYFGRDYALESLFPNFSPNAWEPEFRVFVREEIESFAAEYEAENRRKLVKDKKIWLERKVSERKQVRKHASICEEWVKEQERKRKADELRIREERREAILERLKELGWFEEANHWESERSFKAHAFVAKAEPLTDEDWNENRAELIRFVEKLKEKRLAEDRRRTLHKRYTSLAQVHKVFLKEQLRRSLDLLPSIGDLVTFDEVTRLIEGTPIKQDLPWQDMRALIDELAETRFPEWRTVREDELVGLINAADTERARPATRADLKLAATVFKRDYARLWYPEVVIRRDQVREMGDEPQLVVRQRAWAVGQVSVRVPLLRLAERLVELAGLDPQVATPADMDRRDAWYARARDMPQRKEGIRAMMWRVAVGEGKDADEFVLLSEKDTAFAREMRGDRRMRNFWGHVELPGLTKKGEFKKRGIRYW